MDAVEQVSLEKVIMGKGQPRTLSLSIGTVAILKRCLKVDLWFKPLAVKSDGVLSLTKFLICLVQKLLNKIKISKLLNPVH